jgi:hypothetical protein
VPAQRRPKILNGALRSFRDDFNISIRKIPDEAGNGKTRRDFASGETETDALDVTFDQKTQSL